MVERNPGISQGLGELKATEPDSVRDCQDMPLGC